MAQTFTCPVDNATGVFIANTATIGGSKSRLLELSCGHFVTVPLATGTLTHGIKDSSGAAVLNNTALPPKVIAPDPVMQLYLEQLRKR